MKTAGLLISPLIAGLALAQPQADTIEGYWQDAERRILYSPEAPPGYVFGPSDAGPC